MLSHRSFCSIGGIYFSRRSCLLELEVNFIPSSLDYKKKIVHIHIYMDTRLHYPARLRAWVMIKVYSCSYCKTATVSVEQHVGHKPLTQALGTGGGGGGGEPGLYYERMWLRNNPRGQDLTLYDAFTLTFINIYVTLLNPRPRCINLERLRSHYYHHTLVRSTHYTSLKSNTKGSV